MSPSESREVIKEETAVIETQHALQSDFIEVKCTWGSRNGWERSSEQLARSRGSATRHLISTEIVKDIEMKW